jgi:hypothetical protein
MARSRTPLLLHSFRYQDIIELSKKPSIIDPARKTPALPDLSFTHILQTDFVKEPGKTIAIVGIDIISALAIPCQASSQKCG